METYIDKTELKKIRIRRCRRIAKIAIIALSIYIMLMQAYLLSYKGRVIDELLAITTLGNIDSLESVKLVSKPELVLSYTSLYKDIINIGSKIETSNSKASLVDMVFHSKDAKTKWKDLETKFYNETKEFNEKNSIK